LCPQIAAKLAAEMRALGFEVTEHVGKTGLVAIYKNGDGPTIACYAPESPLHCRHSAPSPLPSNAPLTRSPQKLMPCSRRKT
jgi:hypothetical protein